MEIKQSNKGKKHQTHSRLNHNKQKAKQLKYGWVMIGKGIFARWWMSIGVVYTFWLNYSDLRMNDEWMIYPSNVTHMFAPRTIEITAVLLLPLFFPIQCAISPSEDEYSIKLSMKITINSNENQIITRKSLYAAPHTNFIW